MSFTDFISATTQKDSLQVRDSVVIASIPELSDTIFETTSANQGGFGKAVQQQFEDMNAPELSQVITPSKIFWTIIFLLFGYFMIRLFVGLLNAFSERSSRYRIPLKRLIPVIKILGWIIIFYIIIQGVIRPPKATVFAFFTSIGVAVGFAAQDLLKNIFGGFMIIFDRPFQIGDKIEAGNYYGEVIKIGLRSTRIVTPDDSVVSIPNSEMMNRSISNANSGETNCQVVTEIFLPLDADTDIARKVAYEAAIISKYVYLNKPIVVNFSNVFIERRSLLKMKVKAYVSDIRDEFKLKSEITEVTVQKLIQIGILNKEFIS